MAIIDKIQLSGTVYTIGNETTTAVTSASTDNEIPTAKAVYDAIPQGGGGKAISAGTNISVTTGETADTINCTLPISADSKGIYTTSTYPFLSTSNKSGNVVFGYNNRLDTFGSSSYSKNNLFFGSDNRISVNGSGMLIGGLNNGNNGNYSNLTACVVLGLHNIVGNPYEFASGAYNATHYSSTVFGNSGNTLFSVGNGDFFSRGNHNALEIRQNGDIYIADTNDTSTTNYYEKPMIKLQDALGGGGSSYTAGDGIDITNDVISVTGKVDTTTYNTYTAATDTALASKADTATTYTKAETMDFLTRKADTATTYTKAEVDTAIQDSLSGYVYTADNGKQDIYGSKTFIGSKKISFTQARSNDKLGFTLYDVRDEQGNAKEFGAFELNPTGITENGVTHPLLTLNHYRGNNCRDVQTYIGYRQYDYPHSAAYHLLAPLPENAKTPFSLTTNYKNFYMPLGIKVGNSTMVKADSGGVMDISSYIGGGGGKAVSGGTNISITTGETADTINCTLPISADTNSITINRKNIRFGNSTTSNFDRVQFAFGDNCSASGIYSMAMGANTQASNYCTFAYGYRAVADNKYQTSFGRNPLSSVGSSTFGDSGNTLFCVGNALADTDSSRHNAFEIRQNGDIYLSLNGQDVKLQDQLGGGGGKAVTGGTNISVTTGTTADTINCTLNITNGTGPKSIVISNGKATDTSSFAIGDGTKNQSLASEAKGITSFSCGLKTIANKNYSAAFGDRVNTNNANEFSCGRFNNSVSVSTTLGDSGNTLFSVGNGTADNARHNAFEIRQNGDIYLNDGSKLQDTVSATAANTTALGGLSLVKLTQAQYDALATKDSNVLYVIVG